MRREWRSCCVTSVAYLYQESPPSVTGIVSPVTGAALDAGVSILRVLEAASPWVVREQVRWQFVD